MSEIKGQLLGILMVMVLFTSITIGLVETFKGTSRSITSRTTEETSFVGEN